MAIFRCMLKPYRILTGICLGTMLWTSAAAASTADDVKDLDFLVGTIRENYAGFGDKVTPELESQLATLTEQLREKAGHSDEVELLQMMRQWADFFKDNRLRILFTDAHQAEFSREAASHAKQKPAVTEESVHDYLTNRKDQLDPLEGIWTNLGEATELAIIRDDSRENGFVAVVLKTPEENWLPGFVKAELDPPNEDKYPAILLGRSFLRYRSTGHLLADGAVLKLGDYWKKVSPEPQKPVDLDRYVPGKDFALVPLSDQTLLLRVPDLYDNHKIILDRLFEENAALIAKTPNWVIDLRFNDGGSDFVFETLIEYLYSRPVYQIGYEFLATPANIDCLQNLLRIPNLPPDGKQQIEILLGRMKQHLHQFVTPSEKQFTIITKPVAHSYPKKVGIILTGASGSGEQFVLGARQSRKVVLFGDHTAGSLDYSTVNRVPFPSGRFELFYPISRSLRLPEESLDNRGIGADIPIPKSERDPIGFVQSWLETPR
jgi:peptidase S41-like protein